MYVVYHMNSKVNLYKEMEGSETGWKEKVGIRRGSLQRLGLNYTVYLCENVLMKCMPTKGSIK